MEEFSRAASEATHQLSRKQLEPQLEDTDFAREG